jgi:hypothetical protein
VSNKRRQHLQASPFLKKISNPTGMARQTHSKLAWLEALLLPLLDLLLLDAGFVAQPPYAIPVIACI